MAVISLNDGLFLCNNRKMKGIGLFNFKKSIMQSFEVFLTKATCELNIILKMIFLL
jgi:hypothetical protein